MRWLGVAIALTACSKEAPPAETRAPAEPRVIDARPTKDFVALLTASNKPALVGPFAPLKLSPTMTIRAAREVAPELVRTPMKELDWFEHTSDDYPGLRFRVERVGQLDDGPYTPDDWLVGRLRIVFPDASIRARLVAAWGEPREGGKVAYWFDPVAKLRCGLEASVLDCQGYLPLADLIGTGPRFGFEGDRPLLGAAAKEVRARWGIRVFDGARIVLWPTELHGFPTSIEFTEPLDMAEKITGWNVTLDDATAARAQLEAKLGKPRDVDGDLVFSVKPRIALVGGQLQVGTQD